MGICLFEETILQQQCSLHVRGVPVKVFGHALNIKNWTHVILGIYAIVNSYIFVINVRKIVPMLCAVIFFYAFSRAYRGTHEARTGVFTTSRRRS